MPQNVPAQRLKGGNTTTVLPSGKASNPPWRDLTTNCSNFRKNKITGQWHREGLSADPVEQGLLHGAPQKYTIINIVVGSFGLDSVLPEGSALDSCSHI